MEKLRTLHLPAHRGWDFFLTVFVEPDPREFDSFEIPSDTAQWGLSLHFLPAEPSKQHVEVARIDTAHGEPHFHRLFEPTQPTEWLGDFYTYETSRRAILANWREYADRYLENHLESMDRTQDP